MRWKKFLFIIFSFIPAVKLIRSEKAPIALKAVLCECAAIQKFQISKKHYGGILHNGKHYRKPVLQFSMSGELIREWKSAYAVELELGFYSTLISRCCREKQSHHKGFIWEFKTQKNV